MVFTIRDLDVLRLIRWCQYVAQTDIEAIASKTEIENLIAMHLIKTHKKSGSLVLTIAGNELSEEAFSDEICFLQQCYREEYIQRRLRISKIVMTAYRAYMDVFLNTSNELERNASMYLTSLTRTRGHNPWGNTRIASLMHLGAYIVSAHYVTAEIGYITLHDEITAFVNQTHKYKKLHKAFLLFGETYTDIFAELDRPAAGIDAGKIYYGDLLRQSPYPVFLVPCNKTGVLQLRLLSLPDYRERVSRVALKARYMPSPRQEWDAMFEGAPFLVAVDMDLRRIETAIEVADDEELGKVVMVALPEQAEAVYFKRYRDTGRARVFTLTRDALSEVLQGKIRSYRPPQTQFVTEKGEVLHAPLIKAHRKTGK